MDGTENVIQRWRVSHQGGPVLIVHRINFLIATWYMYFVHIVINSESKCWVRVSMAVV